MSKVRLRQNFRFRGLGNMYAEDERFARNYEAVKKGLSDLLSGVRDTAYRIGCFSVVILIVCCIDTCTE